MVQIMFLKGYGGGFKGEKRWHCISFFIALPSAFPHLQLYKNSKAVSSLDQKQRRLPESEVIPVSDTYIDVHKLAEMIINPFFRKAAHFYILSSCPPILTL
jgi:hypothetical protein